MSRLPIRESGGGVLSFTFLDVLTCTMGSLVLLVVILGQKAEHTRLEDALRNGPRRGVEGGAKPPATADLRQAAGGDGDVAANLAKVREDELKLAALRAKAAERVGEESARVSHLEEHERRLEHELGQLRVTLDRLENAEKKQTVDQATAERDLERLKQLVIDTEAQLDSLRSNPGSQKSFAIVPYKGASGTYRRPIYIECTKDAVTIQPEGIQLTAIDFDGPVRSGNPLAAAVRAAREELNARAAAAGQTDLPDPYPLLIVRPDGARAYAAALSAISAWDADYGYEFVDADWKLEFPDPDPRLGQAMVHAVEAARSRQAMLAKVAPRRYASRLTATGRGAGGGGGAGGNGADSGGGFDTIAQSSGSGDRIGERGSDGFLGAAGGGAEAGGDDSLGGAGSASTGSGGAGGASGGNFADQFSPPAGGGAKPQAAEGDGAGGEQGESLVAAGAGGGGQGGGAGVDGGGGAKPQAAGTEGGGPGGPASSGSTTASSQSAGGGGGDGGASSGQAGGVVSVTAGQTTNREAAASAAETRGANWANAAASRRASPITRPIQVVVRPEQLDVLPTLDVGATRAIDPTVVSFQQPTDKVLDELAAVLEQHIKDWGSAGQGMYWRPTLVLQVAPGADQHAARLNDLLADSGVDIRLQQVASRPNGGSVDARR